jgi:hypothetical protein
VTGKRLFTLTPKSGGGPVLKKVLFTRATGCAAYPEAALDASGKPAKGPTSFGQVSGLVEGHMHWMTYEFLGGKFHCGRPWHPYGIPYALPDCSSDEGPQGSAAPFQNFLNYGSPQSPHDTSGYPTLKEWSASNLTYEGTYWRWIQRAWMGGLRLMVMGINENRVLCELQANKQTNCNEMDTVRRGLKDIRDLQHYVDAQAGGPGKGFFQIVTNPYDARRVINRGKMAVVLEIEVSEPFDCRGWDQPSCNQQQVDKQFDEMRRRGVRSMLLLNKFDNPLTCASTAARWARSSTPATRTAPARSGARAPAPARCTTTRSTNRTRSRRLHWRGCSRAPACRAEWRPPTRPRRTATRAASPTSGSTSCAG